jgi:hypothetical protein
MINEAFVQLGVETTPGTVASTFVSVPVEKFDTKLKSDADYPEESRGDGEEAHLALKSLEVQESSMGGRIYHDAFEPILRAQFGAPTITVNADGTRTLVFTGKAAPPTLSQRWFDKVTGRQSLGSVMDELGITFGGEDKLMWDGKLLGQPEADVAQPTPSFSESVPFLHWQANVQIGGSVSAELISYKLAYKRNVKPFYTARGGTTNSRAPLRFDYGRRGGSLEVILDFLTQAEYLLAKSLAARGVVVTFTDNDTTIGTGTRKPSLKIDVPRAVWSEKEIDLGGTTPALKLSSPKLLAGAQGSVIVTLETV